MCPLSRRPCNAVNAARGAEAACSNVTLSGFVTNVDSGAQTYSAKAPWQWTQTAAPESCGSLTHEPNTSSPGLNCVTFLPTASILPATSRPGRVSFGLRSPNSMRALYGLPFIKPPSSGLTEAARNFYQNFIVPGNGLLDIRDLDNIRRSVSGIDGGFHVRIPAALACSFHR